ncbi:MAG: aminotransferase [Novosphingobium sp.]
MPIGHPLYASMGTTIFEHMSALARSLGAINLGQGFPDDAGPDRGGVGELIEAAARALREQSSQYPPSTGLPELRDAIAGFYRRTRFDGQAQALELMREQVIVTSGATEALAATIFALVEPGDEVILFEPAYDAYAPLVRRAGGVPIFVMLQPPQWRYRREDIEAAITPRTRAIIVNDPLNPAGSVASADELAMLAALCIRHDLVAICDEVWEDVRFGGPAHRSLLALPGMAGRAVKIGSAGKLFGLTGWKIGWICASAELAQTIGRAHQFLTFTTPPALQWAVAAGLMLPDAWFARRDRAWAASRQRLMDGLSAAGFAIMPGAATWFVCVDLAASGIALGDRDFAERAVREGGVATIPVSALCESADAPTHIVRLCFTKGDEHLDEATARLAAFRDKLV